MASNIPDGDAGTGEGSRANTNATRERVNYEVSETEKEIVRGPGAIKRLTVAVLVNGVTTEIAEGQTEFQPRPEEELEALRELISSAVGFDPNRGDVITLKSMDLPNVEPEGTAVTASFFDNLYFDVMSIIQMAALALVALILGLFVVRPILAGNGASVRSLPAPDGATAGGGLPELPHMAGDDSNFMTNPDLGANIALDGEIDSGGHGDFAPMGELPGMGDGLNSFGGGMSDDPVDRLRSMIGERQEETVQILRGWLEENNEERAG